MEYEEWNCLSEAQKRARLESMDDSDKEELLSLLKEESRMLADSLSYKKGWFLSSDSEGQSHPIDDETMDFLERWARHYDSPKSFVLTCFVRAGVEAYDRSKG